MKSKTGAYVSLAALATGQLGRPGIVPGYLELTKTERDIEYKDSYFKLFKTEKNLKYKDWMATCQELEYLLPRLIGRLHSIEYFSRQAQNYFKVLWQISLKQDKIIQ